MTGKGEATAEDAVVRDATVEYIDLKLEVGTQ